MIESYDSTSEVRHGCEHGMPGFISHQPTIENLEIMYAIQNKDGLILTETGTYDRSPNISDIIWHRFFLEAEESTTGTSNTVVSAITLMKSLMLMKDSEITELHNKLAELYREHVKLKEAHQFIEEMYLTKRKQADLLKIELDKVIQAHKRTTN